MTTYTIFELPHVNAHVRGEVIEAKDLTSAKRKARRAQAFQGTVLVIEQACEMVAYTENGKLVNC